MTGYTLFGLIEVQKRGFGYIIKIDIGYYAAAAHLSSHTGGYIGTAYLSTHIGMIDGQ